MARSSFPGAPELSRLFDESPTELLCDFMLREQFSVFLGKAMSDVPSLDDEQVLRGAIRARLKKLAADRRSLMEIEARRVMAMADDKPDILLRKLGDTPRFGARTGLKAQRDAVARSLWAYLRSTALFDAAERAMQVRIYREHGTLYETWSIGASIPVTADLVDTEALATEIAARLHHDEGCSVEAVDLPADEGESREVLIAITFVGDYTGHKTVRPDRKTDIVYLRPPEEMLLVYSPDRRRIEVCSRDASERRLVANIFAADTLKHDISNKPLMQKTYNLARFRNSLKLTVPENEAHRVHRACITDVQVALGDWSRKVSLGVAADDDIDAIARSVFGAIIPNSGGGYLTRVRFHIDHVNGRGRRGSLQFDVFGRNKSNIQSERDPAKRALGYDLLEAWGVLERVGDLPLAERTEKLPQLLALYDIMDTEVSGRVLDDLGIAAGALTGAGFLARKGRSDVILFEDDQLGDVIHHVEGGRSDGQVTLNLIEGASGPLVPAEDLARFEIRFDYLRDALRDVLRPMGLKGRVREVAAHLHQIGTAQLGQASVPVHLARALADDRLLEGADRLIRGEGSQFRGIVFVPQGVRLPYMGCHVVLSLKAHLDPETGQIDAEAVRQAYEAAIDPAARGAAVHFRKQGDDAAQITVPGQDPRIVTGPKKVRLFECLYNAHRNREPGVKLSVLRAFAGFSQLPQLFGAEWGEVNGRYLYSPRRAYWALCDRPISV